MDDNEKAVTELPKAVEPSATDKIIDAWHRDHFAGTATTEAWNHSVKAKEELKKLLAK
jgi:hypothetical protein